MNNVTKAGLPDFMLYHRGGSEGQCAMAEVKTWWSYLSSKLFALLSNEILQLEGGIVQWAKKGVESDILKQVGKYHWQDILTDYLTNDLDLVGNVRVWCQICLLVQWSRHRRNSRYN